MNRIKNFLLFPQFKFRRVSNFGQIFSDFSPQGTSVIDPEMSGCSSQVVSASEDIEPMDVDVSYSHLGLGLFNRPKNLLCNEHFLGSIETKRPPEHWRLSKITTERNLLDMLPHGVQVQRLTLKATELLHKSKL